MTTSQNDLAPAPIRFNVEADGVAHFADGDMPRRTEIDTHGMAFFGEWLKIDCLRGQVVITLDGRTVVYQRVATELHGRWVCDLLEDTHNALRRSPEGSDDRRSE